MWRTDADSRDAFDSGVFLKNQCYDGVSGTQHFGGGPHFYVMRFKKLCQAGRRHHLLLLQTGHRSAESQINQRPMSWRDSADHQLYQSKEHRLCYRKKFTLSWAHPGYFFLRPARKDTCISTENPEFADPVGIERRSRSYRKRICLYGIYPNPKPAKYIRRRGHRAGEQTLYANHQ